MKLIPCPKFVFLVVGFVGEMGHPERYQRRRWIRSNDAGAGTILGADQPEKELNILPHQTTSIPHSNPIPPDVWIRSIHAAPSAFMVSWCARSNLISVSNAAFSTSVVSSCVRSNLASVSKAAPFRHPWRTSKSHFGCQGVFLNRDNILTFPQKADLNS